MTDYIDRELEPLVARLRARYPGVRIVWAYLRRQPPSSPLCGELYQAIRYQAPLEQLKALGLVSPAMLKSRDGDLTAGILCGVTELGDAFHLCAELDQQSRPGHWDLTVNTGETPRERRRISTREAERLVRRVLRSRAAP